MLRIIFYNFLFVILIIFSLEIFVRFLDLSQALGIDKKLIAMDESRFHFKYKKNSEGKVFGNLSIIDERGFRVPYKGYKYEKKKNILIIGDSVAFGNGVDENITFVGKIRQNLKNYNVHNFSLPGYQIKNHLINLEDFSDLLQTEKVIYFFTLNDINIDPNISVSPNIRTTRTKEQYDDWVKDLRRIKIIAHLNNFLRKYSHLYLFIKGVASDPSKRWFLDDLSMYNEKNVQALDELFSILNTKISKNSVDFKVIILPYEYQTRKSNCNDNYLTPQIEVKNILEKYDIKYLDYTNNFCEYKNPKTLFHHFDPMHLSEKGHEFLYGLIKDEI